MRVFGGIEAGGTKWECAVGTGPEDVRAAETIPTTAPDETIGRAVAFFEREGRVDAIGIGSFGPVDLDPASATWGHVTTTPKPGWANAAVGPEIRRRLAVPVAFDTDVNAAALGEQRWGAAKGLETFCYVTVGTGIGGGVVVDGKPLHGLLHPEFGHLRVPRVADDSFPGSCPYHGDCLEGLASGPAVEARWGRPPRELLDDEAVWALEARYLALGLVSAVCVLSPQRIVLGGGIGSVAGLLERVRNELAKLLGGYLSAPALTEGMADYLVAPALGRRSGVLGAFALAETAT